MKTLTAALSLAALATGTAGAALAYVSTAPDSATVPAISSPAPTSEAAVATRPRTKVKVHFRKCRSGAHLEHGQCVRHVVRTVIEPAPALAAVSTTSSSNHSSTVSRDESPDDRGDRPRQTRHEAAEPPEHEGRDETKGPEDHASEDAPETED